MSSTGATPALDFASSSIERRGSSGADAVAGRSRRVRRNEDGGQKQDVELPIEPETWGCAGAGRL